MRARGALGALDGRSGQRRRLRGRERVSVVIPVKDGARYLEELLAALRREGADEVLVIDSGSRDGSVAIARAAGAEVLEIAPGGVRPRAHAQPRRRADRPAS